MSCKEVILPSFQFSCFTFSCPDNKALLGLEENASPLRTCADILGKWATPFSPMTSRCLWWHHSTLHSTDSQRASGLTHHSGLGVPLSAIAEGGGQGGGAALVVQGRPTVVDGWVDGDGPHAWGIAIAVAVVVAAPIPRCPHVDAAFASSALEEDRRDPANSHAHGNQGLKGVLQVLGIPHPEELDLSFLSSSTKWLDLVLSGHENHYLLMRHQEIFPPVKIQYIKLSELTI